MFALTHTWDSPTDWVTQASFLGDRSLVSKKMNISIYWQAEKLTDYVWHLQLRKEFPPMKWDNQSLQEIEVLPYSGWTFSGLLTDGVAPFLKSNTHSTMIKLKAITPYLKIPKNINHVTRPLTSPDISIFSSKIGNFRSVKK